MGEHKGAIAASFAAFESYSTEMEVQEATEVIISEP